MHIKMWNTDTRYTEDLSYCHICEDFTRCKFCPRCSTHVPKYIGWIRETGMCISCAESRIGITSLNGDWDIINYLIVSSGDKHPDCSDYGCSRDLTWGVLCGDCYMFDLTIQMQPKHIELDERGKVVSFITGVDNHDS